MGRLPRKHVGSVATPEQIGVVLHPLVQLVLLGVAKRAAHLRGRRPLRAGEVSRRLLHVALELGELLQHLLPLGRQLLRLLELLAGHALRNGAPVGRIWIAEDLPEPALEVLLARRELVRPACQIAHLLAGLIAAHAAHHVLRLAQTVGCAAGIRLILRLVAVLGRTGPAHVVGGFLEALQGLLQARIAWLLLPSLPARCGLLRRLPRPAGLSRLRPAGLRRLRLARLRGLAGLARLLPGLVLLGKLLHLPLQFLGLPPQHLLLPALLESLLRLRAAWAASSCCRRASCSSRCSASSISRARWLAAAAGSLLPGLVLVLLGVEFQVEQVLQVAALPPPPPPPPPAARRGCRRPPGSGGRWPRPAAGAAAPSAPAPGRPATSAPSASRRPSPMSSAACSMSSEKLLNSSFCAESSRRPMRVASDCAWSRSLDCISDRNCAFSAAAFLSARLVAELVPGGRDDLLLPLGNLALLLAAASFAPALRRRRPSAATACTRARTAAPR